MEFTVHLFASLKENAGTNQIQVVVDKPATVAALLEKISTQYPALRSTTRNILVSVNHKFAVPSQTISSSDEIALFPPVSGG
ncbi:MAG: MoaD/ThiS family protein [Leptolinea sp.]|nr:MoaD/ThiS family protein [Leptolinea sp.]